MPGKFLILLLSLLIVKTIKYWSAFEYLFLSAHPSWKVTASASDPQSIYPQIHLNKYETEPYSLQIFQSNTSVCLTISVFCQSCKPICEPEITKWKLHLDNLKKSKQNNFTFIFQFTTLTKHENKHWREL